jgi:hypothetical protein
MDAWKSCLGGQGLRHGLDQGWMWGSGLLDVKTGSRSALKTFIKVFLTTTIHLTTMGW